MNTETTYERVVKWNERCNNTPGETGTEEYWTALSNQTERIEEGLNELKEAIEARDTVEVFDALLDLDVVVSSGLYLSNGDYAGGINAVLDNNDHKFTTVRVSADAVAIHYGLKEVDVELHRVTIDGGCLLEPAYYSIHRISDNKIMKFPNHPKVDLTPFAPKGGE